MTIAGIFIGGAATRLGGIAKGMLEAPDGSGPLARRLADMLEALGIPTVFVGSRPGYESVGLPTVEDRGAALGPLGGLLALYEHARGERVVVLGCDMPFVTRATLERLARSEAPIAAARRAGRWEPFLSVHDPLVMRPRAEANAAAGRLSLQALFEGAEEIPVDPRELEDWDSPDDVERSRRAQAPSE